MSEFAEHPAEAEEEGVKSKSEVKRELHALRDVGERLVGLPAAALARIPLPEELAAAVQEARRITAHGALKRQIGYIGKLLRAIDPEPIQQALADLDAGQRSDARRFHALEQWRDRLLAEGDEAVSAFLLEYPDAEAQPLRQLLRNARREQDAGKPPATARKLFRYLREVTGG